MRHKIIKGGFLTLLLLCLVCNNSSNPTTTDPDPIATNKQGYGGFQVTLMDVDGYTTVMGLVSDGPTPSGTIWEEAQAVGSCKLFKPRVPFCSQSCGSNGACVEDDSCMAYPQSISAGILTVTGVKKSDGTTSFTAEPRSSLNYLPIGIAYPPFADGDVVTFSLAGSESVPAFTLTAKGISPLVVLNDTIVMADGQPINLLWTPPATAGNSKISIYVDISHHGGTKGKIECECDDNGSLTIPAVLLDQLKTLGISGYPKIEITRTATGTSSVTNAELVLESKVTKILEIPGIKSCMDDEECPDGQLCGQDMKCQ